MPRHYGTLFTSLYEHYEVYASFATPRLEPRRTDTNVITTQVTICLLPFTTSLYFTLGSLISAYDVDMVYAIITITLSYALFVVTGCHRQIAVTRQHTHRAGYGVIAWLERLFIIVSLLSLSRRRYNACATRAGERTRILFHISSLFTWFGILSTSVSYAANSFIISS